jgi:hypothetical protein
VPAIELKTKFHFVKSDVQTGASGTTREIVGTGKRVAIWGVFAGSATTTAVTVSVQNQAGTVLWVGRTTAAVGGNCSQSFIQPVLSLDGLQIVSTGGTNGCDVNCCYEEF